MSRASRIFTLGASLWLCGLCCPELARASPEPEPEPDELPTWTEAPEPAQPRPEPPKGNGLYGAGIFGVTFGILNIGYGIPLSITGPGDAYFSGTIPIVFGTAFIALGAVGIHYGRRRRAVWKAWDADPTAPPLVFERRTAPRHVPWLIVGGATVPLGLATIGVMIPELTDPILNTPTFAYWVTGWGGVTVVAGAAMLGVGVARYLQTQRRATSRLELVPTGWARRGSAGFGVAGRF